MDSKIQTPAEISRTPGWFALPQVSIWHVTGADQQRFLQGQLTNDVTHAATQQALRSFICNAKGQVEGELFLWKTGTDDFRISTPSAVGEDLAARLDRYIISDDVEITDRSGEFALFHLVGPGTGDLACHVAGQLRARLPEANAPEQDLQTFLNPRYRLSGFDLLVPLGLREAAQEALRERLPEISEPVREALRIARGIPDWAHELSRGVLPAETGLLEQTVSFTKGCYIGQEVISRMKSSGKVRRRLTGLQPLPGTAAGPEPGWELFEPDQGSNRSVGVLTSLSPRLGEELPVGLGLVKDGLHRAGQELVARHPEDAERQAPVQVVDLPLF
jgi:folate-binding protein YgfZ